MTQQVRIENTNAGPHSVCVQTFGGDVLVAEKTLKPGETHDAFVWNGQSLAIRVVAE